MLSIIICEDDIRQLNRMAEVVKNYIMMEDKDAELVLATTDPEEVLSHVNRTTNQTRLYFFDVDLKHDKYSGLTLASEIRKTDDVGKIVFVTTHGELSYLTFTYKVEAMDYIIKDNADEVEKRIRESIDLAIDRYMIDQNSKVKYFKLKMGDSIRSIPYEEIMFFESGNLPHRIMLHTTTSKLEFYGSMKELEEKDECLYRCHKSFIINKDNIRNLNRSVRTAEMMNGEEVLVSIRAMRNLKNIDE